LLLLVFEKTEFNLTRGGACFFDEKQCIKKQEQ
jgi:hypothetical protein